MKNDKNETTEVVADKFTISDPPTAVKADLPHLLSLSPTLPSTVSLPPLLSAELIGEEELFSYSECNPGKLVK